MPGVDVVIPCFNAARYIGAAIDSVLAQDRQPTRIIVVDDGSTDGSAAIVQGYGPCVEYYREPHGGASAARNAGISRASAEYLAFLDADDLWTARSLSTRLDHLEGNCGVDAVFAALTQFPSPELEEFVRRRIHFDARPAVARVAGTCLVRRAAFARVGPFNESLRVGEMIEWLARAEAVGISIETIPQIVLSRRIHDANTTQRTVDANAGYLRAVRDALDRKRAATAKPL